MLPVLCHESATTCQIDLSKVSNSELKPDLSKSVKTKVIESTAPPQQPYKRGTIFSGHPVYIFVYFHLQGLIVRHVNQAILAMH